MRGTVDFKTLKGIYFLGIGGIGMSALARYFNSMDIPVAGYDRTETRLTKSLVRHRGSEIAAQMEREGKLFSDQLGSPDFAESVAAMMQKRAPVYP